MKSKIAPGVFVSAFLLVLSVYGAVKPRAYLSSDIVRLTGRAGTQIKQEVTISQSPANPFKVIEVKAEKGDNIRCFFPVARHS